MPARSGCCPSGPGTWTSGRWPRRGGCWPISAWPRASTSRPGPARPGCRCRRARSEEHTSELQSRVDLVCRVLLEKKNRYGSVSRQVIKNTKWLATKRGLKNIVLPPFTHLCGDSPQPPVAYSFIHVFFFFIHATTTEIYTLSLHDALPI